MRAIAVVPAFQNEPSIRDTVATLLADLRIAEVLVVDDGSTDATAREAAAAGARVIRLGRNAGKGAALERAAAEIEGRPEPILFVDADTGLTAAAAVRLLDPIEGGAADMVVGVLPPAGRSGGFGLVRRTASLLIRLSSGHRSAAPLSGQRALSSEVLRACRPLASGFGVDPALTADAARRGFRILEQPIDMSHSYTGRATRGFTHRGRQGWDLLKAFLPRLSTDRISKNF